MINAKKFKTKLLLNIRKIERSDISSWNGVTEEYITPKDVLEWVNKQWTEFLERQFIPTKGGGRKK